VGTHVLLVEDNDLNQLVARELLEQAGLTVTIASNGQEGVEALQRQRFDGVLMDMQMPVMDGISATHAIRADSRFKDLPIIAMTANALVGDRERALAEGMDDYVTKPLDIEHMFTVLRKWLPRARRLSAAAEPPPAPVVKAPEFAVPEVDFAVALRYVNGNRDLLRRVQSRFIVMLRDFDKDFRHALVEQSMTDALRLVHTVKGIAGTVGALRVQSMADGLEEAFRAEGATAQSIEPALLLLLDAIDHALAALELCVDNDIHRPALGQSGLGKN
jgi:CheY-like chemotaxis protein